MVKVQIPFTSDLKNAGKSNGKDGSDLDNENDEDEDEVGIMSDSEESDVDDDIGDPDWEEVKGEDDDDFSFKPGQMKNNPGEGLTITLGRKPRRKRGDPNDQASDGDEDSVDDGPTSRKRKKSVDINEILRKSINRVKITEQLMKHKLSLLLYLARGLRLVKIVNCNIIRGLSMSLIDSRFVIKGRRKTDRQLLELFMEQFNDVISISSDDDKRMMHMQQPFMLNLLDCFSSLETTSLIELTVMFVSCLKALRPSLPMRIVNVLRPVTLRADIIPKPTINSDGTQVVEVKEPNKPIEIVEKLDYWVEVYLADEKKWCCVDLCNLKLDEPNVLTELSRPFYYLVSYDVDRYCIKPVEKNYVELWYTPAFRKGRCEDKWWDMVMSKLGPTKESEKDKADENKTEELLLKKDMPTSDNGFRNHPLYVLEKHLLKFQGIYPPDVPPLGFFKETPIYPRDCVQTLRSRETWLRLARTVKLKEEPYKVVKARPKRDRYSGNLIRDLPLELFGEWQTQDYDPPQAEGGKVPRNCYGNVDMYQPCMLPKGCSWLKLSGLQRIAGKLGIDCAQAVIGFDNHCGSYGAHPVMDGFIVCSEFEDTLKMAWEEEQTNIARREQEKRDKRIYDNWKRLLKAAIIREKVRIKYKTA